MIKFELIIRERSGSGGGVDIVLSTEPAPRATKQETEHANEIYQYIGAFLKNRQSVDTIAEFSDLTQEQLDSIKRRAAKR